MFRESNKSFLFQRYFNIVAYKGTLINIIIRKTHLIVQFNSKEIVRNYYRFLILLFFFKILRTDFIRRAYRKLNCQPKNKDLCNKIDSRNRKKKGQTTLIYILDEPLAKRQQSTSPLINELSMKSLEPIASFALLPRDKKPILLYYDANRQEHLQPVVFQRLHVRATRSSCSSAREILTADDVGRGTLARLTSFPHQRSLFLVP